MKLYKDAFYAYIKSMIGIEVDDTTLLFEDAGIDGLDAEQMMIQIAEKYNVDFSDYIPERYHSSEAEFANPFLPIWQVIRGKASKYSCFTALHLYNTVQAGKWFDPVS